jgi:hypothetical protein
MKNAYKILVGEHSLNGRVHSEDADVDEKILLQWILGK